MVESKVTLNVVLNGRPFTGCGVPLPVAPEVINRPIADVSPLVEVDHEIVDAPVAVNVVVAVNVNVSGSSGSMPLTLITGPPIPLFLLLAWPHDDAPTSYVVAPDWSRFIALK